MPTRIGLNIYRCIMESILIGNCSTLDRLTLEKVASLLPSGGRYQRLKTQRPRLKNGSFPMASRFLKQSPVPHPISGNATTYSYSTAVLWHSFCTTSDYTTIFAPQCCFTLVIYLLPVFIIPVCIQFSLSFIQTRNYIAQRYMYMT